MFFHVKTLCLFRGNFYFFPDFVLFALERFGTFWNVIFSPWNVKKKCFRFFCFEKSVVFIEQPVFSTTQIMLFLQNHDFSNALKFLENHFFVKFSFFHIYSIFFTKNRLFAESATMAPNDFLKV